MPQELWVRLASDYERDLLAAELMLGDSEWGEVVARSDGSFDLTLYPSSSPDFLTLDLATVEAQLTEAKSRLTTKPR